MKEKINQIAKGIFEYHMPDTVLLPENLQIAVESGEDYSGSFRVANRAGREMKGVVCTNTHFMQIEESAFQGRDNEIHYTFHAAHYLPGDVISGDIRILSDCGVALLPFSVNVTVPACHASVGRVQNIKQFIELARENTAEAASLFSDVHFQTALLGENGQGQEIYHGLIKGKNLGMAMEEFLLATRQKKPIQLSCDWAKSSGKYEGGENADFALVGGSQDCSQRSGVADRKSCGFPVAQNADFVLVYGECNEKCKDKLVLHKDTWGYCVYGVHADADFIQVERQNIQTTDFVGDSYELEFVLHPEKIRGTKGSGRITITGPWQTLSVSVTLCKSEQEEEERERRWKERQDVMRLYDNFLRFRAKKQNKKAYCNEVERLVCNLDLLSREEGQHDWLARVFRIHLAILNRLDETVGLEMAQIEEQLPELRESSPLFYCAYYYLNALWQQKDEVKEEAVRKIQECYRTSESHWLVLWFLMQLDEKYQMVREKQEAMMEQFRHGCRSPLLYLEMCLMFNANPRALSALDAITEQCLHWGCRQDILNGELCFRYVYLMGRQKRFSPLFLEDLYKIYQSKPTDETLTVICQMLMRGRKTSAEEWKWYQLGIERNLKLTDLYEYYICALEEFCGGDVMRTSEEEALPALPEKVLYYFRYHNHLSEQRQSFLFAYIVRNKQIDKTSYDDYYHLMREYAVGQLEKGRLDRNLAVLYVEFFSHSVPEDSVLAALPSVLFQWEILCTNPEIVGVVVRHPELEREETAPLVKGRAVVSVYTSGAKIYLVDKQGNRFIRSIAYTSRRYLPAERLAAACLSQAGDHEGLLLYLYEKAVREKLAGGDAMELRKRVLGIRGLCDRQRKRVLASLIRFYFEHFEGELLDYQLHHLEWKEVDRSDRPLFVEYCAIRHCSDKGMEGIMEYGYDRFDVGCLFQIASKSFRHMVESPVSQEKPQLVKLAWNIFAKGTMDQVMLQYLCDSYSGTAAEMMRIWRAAKEYGVDVMDFSERLLAQVVFTGEMFPEVYDVFYHYYEKGFNKKLLRAFLKMQAYGYMVKGQELPEAIFDYFYKDVRVEENRPCLLAMLKYLSGKKQLTGEETVFVDYNIHQLCEKNIVLPFFQEFAGRVSVPDYILKEEYVEYTADPAGTVKIQYRIISGGDAGDFVTESMADLFEGIRVKGFVLFQDEVLEYRIIEMTPQNAESVSELQRTGYHDRQQAASANSRYHMLNQMLLYEQQGRETEWIEQMRSYVERDETAKQLLKPLT